MKKTKPEWKLKREKQIRERVIYYPLMILAVLFGIISIGIAFNKWFDRNFIIYRVSADETEPEYGLYAGATDAFLNVDLDEPVEIVEEGTETVEESIDGVADDCPYSYEDLYTLAKCMYCEGGTVCSDETLLYIGSVVVNRMAYDRYFPDTIYEVVFQSGQYSPTWNGAWEKYEPDENCLNLACEILDTYYATGETYIPSTVIYQANYPQGSGTYIESEGLYFCYE